MKELKIATNVKKARLVVEYENGVAFKALAVRLYKKDRVGGFLFETQDGDLLSVSHETFPCKTWNIEPKTIRKTIFYQ